MWLLASWFSCGPAPVPPDADGDHVAPAGGDCDDADPDVHPGATETWYDGIDQDCDGNDTDQDGDGVPVPEDCGDEDPDVHPGVLETLGDLADVDCDGSDAGAFEVWETGLGGVFGPSLDEAEDRVGVVIGTRLTAEGAPGSLLGRSWDTTDGDLVDQATASLVGDSQDYGVSAVDHVERPVEGVRELALGLETTLAYRPGGFGRLWTDRGWGAWYDSPRGTAPATVASLRLSDTRQFVVCGPDFGLAVFEGGATMYEDGVYDTSISSRHDLVRCAATASDDAVLVLTTDGTLSTLDADLHETSSETGWTALDSHHGDVLLGRADQLELRAADGTTDVPIDGTPDAVRLGGTEDARVAAWTSAGIVHLVTLTDVQRTFELDPGPVDDLDVAWSGGMLVVAVRAGDVVRVSRSFLR